MIDPGSAAQRWRDQLSAWAIPPELIASAGRSPWGHPVGRFVAKAAAAVATPEGASYEAGLIALETVRESFGKPGTVLDVGAGAGAASLPLLGHMSALTAVDPSLEMLAALVARADLIDHDAAVRTVEGRWPDAADKAGVHDVVLCHHVLFDVPEVVPFVTALTAAARHRVVVEVPPVHPLTWLNPYFQRFHGLTRPTGPTADDLVAVLHELGIAALSIERWTMAEHWLPAESERVALATQRLALPVTREAEVAAALAGVPSPKTRRVVTLSWSGSALVG